MKIKQTVIFFFLLILSATRSVAQQPNLSEQIAATAMNSLWRDSSRNENGEPSQWSYEQGVVLKGIEGVWLSTGDGRYFSFIQKGMDNFVNADGSIRTYKAEDYNLDNINSGKILLLLYKVTGQDKYRKAAALLREQLKNHPRTSDGGFWHKKIYPNQMWLDGLYMAEPFYAEYAATFHEQSAFDDIAKQFILMESHARDPRTGLLYHGWDESKQQRWADPATGHSPNFWDRAMGWYAMALVDTLEFFPRTHPQRAELIAIFNRLAKAVAKYQDTKTGLWYEVVDKGSEKGNYLEASGSSMFVYALAKGVRDGYVPASYLSVAKHGYNGLTSEFIKTDANGETNLDGTVSVAGLGGNPYRDGSYQYYLSERVVRDDPKGIGAFLMASNEMNIAAKQSTGKGKTVVLDSYFNNETKKDATGEIVSWHYKWDELPNSGFSLWGNVFRAFGVKTDTLYSAPSAANLNGADIYIIVDPDTETETPKPNYVSSNDVRVISNWVKAGGVLVLMGNDVGNAEFDHFNELARAFGIEFNKDSRNKVPGNDYSMGRLVVQPPHPIFKTARNLYLKEISTLQVKSPARAVFIDKGDNIMAVAKFGKGTVFAVGDPWLYNEYTDGRKLPAEYDNFKAANDLALWLIQQTRK
ncbi:MAG TPA: glycoside hydrolase family 88 protein [Pyrinomonadaceae bacterium]|jgi:unsaturated rhamnogalacturonyl hydrolase|nr:glycoside hydrolase family 88 protein [Pyrinomonadaceae bacterium]